MSPDFPQSLFDLAAPPRGILAGFAAMSPEEKRAARRAYYQARRGHLSEYQRHYKAGRMAADPAYAGRIRASNRRCARDRQKAHARDLAKSALRRGLLTPTPCAQCGSTQHLEMHHPSYARGRELEVVFLCADCHEQLHVRLRQRTPAEVRARIAYLAKSGARLAAPATSQVSTVNHATQEKRP